MQYSRYTGKLEDDVVLEPTNAMVGPASGFLCYPKTVQEIEFTKGGTGPNAILGTRTQEGLFINLDLHIECVLLPRVLGCGPLSGSGALTLPARHNSGIALCRLR